MFIVSTHRICLSAKATSLRRLLVKGQELTENFSGLARDQSHLLRHHRGDRTKLSALVAVMFQGGSESTVPYGP